MRICIQYLAGTPTFTVQTVRVRVTKDGLPSFIPIRLRQAFALGADGAKVIRGVLSVLSIFRVFPTKVKPDFSVITDQFSGLAPTLLIERVVKHFIGRNKIK